MRLADGLARTRIVYPRPLPTLPDIMLIDLPPRCRSPLLSLGRYYPVIVEADREQQEFDDFLHAERVRPVAPDLLDRRASMLTVSQTTFAHYDPPMSGWPWILLCRWTADDVSMADGDGLFARSAYTIEMFADAAGRAAATTALLVSLGTHRPVSVVRVPPSPCAGLV